MAGMRKKTKNKPKKNGNGTTMRSGQMRKKTTKKVAGKQGTMKR